jgi:hypothetical protein
MDKPEDRHKDRHLEKRGRIFRIAAASLLAGAIASQIPAANNTAFARGAYVSSASSSSNLITLSDSQVKGSIGALAALGIIILVVKRGEPIWPGAKKQAPL